jgi:hypothetical protein
VRSITRFRKALATLAHVTGIERSEFELVAADWNWDVGDPSGLLGRIIDSVEQVAQRRLAVAERLDQCTGAIEEALGELEALETLGVEREGE